MFFLYDLPLGIKGEMEVKHGCISFSLGENQESRMSLENTIILPQELSSPSPQYPLSKNLQMCPLLNLHPTARVLQLSHLLLLSPAWCSLRCIIHNTERKSNIFSWYLFELCPKIQDKRKKEGKTQASTMEIYAVSWDLRHGSDWFWEA